MNRSIDTAHSYYAVISVRNDSHGERLIIAYPDEKTLRQLIAAPSILALGYSSRAEAAAYRKDVAPAASALPLESNAKLSGAITRSVSESSATRWAAKGAVDLSTTSKRIRYLVEYTFAVAIALIYSQNLVSAMLRALVSL